MSEAANTPKQKMSPFPRTFYVANVMEIFERMAWYGFFALSSLYMTSPTEQGGLGFTSIQRGILQGIIPFLLYLFPVITGALADRYGYRRTFLVAFSILTPAYFLLGQFHTFWGFFGAFLLVAVGAATFKPVVVGTVGRVTDDSNRGMAFGIFYMIVNVGGFVGPIFAGMLRVLDWNYVFVLLAITIAINFIPTLFFYKEPTDESKSATRRSLKKVLLDAQEVLGNGRFALTVIPVIFLLMLAGGEWIGWNWALGLSVAWIAANLVWNVFVKGGDDAPWLTQKAKLGNWPFVLYLLILSGFWASFNQIFITLPEYIRDFVNTTDLVKFAGIFGHGFVSFLASVNIHQLSTELVRLVNEYGAPAAGQGHEILFHIVHFKVRPPIEEITTTFQSLVPFVSAYSDSLNHVTNSLLSLHSAAGIDTTAFQSAFSEMVFRYGSIDSAQAAPLVGELAKYSVSLSPGELSSSFQQLAPVAAPIKDVAVNWTNLYRQVNPEYLVNIDAGAIVLFQVLVSWIIQRWKPFPVLVVGTIVAGTGIALNSIAVAGALTIFAIVVFAFGEMIASPKSQEYVARIAPRNKTALFMGYYFVSVALGNLFGGILSGWGYEVLAKEQNKPELMWIIYGLVGFATAVALLIFNKLVVPTLERNHAASRAREGA